MVLFAKAAERGVEPGGKRTQKGGSEVMTVADIESWVRGGESETVEFKRTTGERREAARTICAMLEELTVRAGLPRPEIIEAGGCVMVRFSPSRYVPPQRVAQNVTERQQRVLAFLSGCPSGAPVREIAAGLGLSETPRSLREDLTTLKLLGLVSGDGWGRGARWRLA
jgi:ATP-dependent DNA helicase RecG